MRPTKTSLPVDLLVPQLQALLGRESSAVLRAPAGAGKTTRVPPSLLRLTGDRQVVVLEPRRLAARAAAQRIADENGWRLGEEVGYEVRFDRRCGADTRLLVLTQGIFLRRLQSDPFLERVGAVLFDEFHERSLEGDLALAMTRQVQREVRSDLRVVVMSATLDTGPVASFLGGCTVLESQGRSHPTEIFYQGSGPAGDPRLLSANVVSAVKHALQADGDILVFLPGVGEIHQVAEDLSSLAALRNLLLVKLYGDLPLRDQDTALRAASRRKVVLATNVAETSVTVEGVGAVVDSGLARVLRYDSDVGLDRLELSRISRASADQRAGRAGREGPGVVIRLWSEHEHRGLLERPVPEVQRIDLAGPALQLLAWGEPDPNRFGWFEAPDPSRLESALAALETIGAVRRGAITPLGRTLSRFPVQPRIARLLLEGHRLGDPERVALLAALLSERDPFPISRLAPSRCLSDYAGRLEALANWSETGAAATDARSFNPGAARFLFRVRDQLLTNLSREAGPTESRRRPAGDVVGKSLLTAFPDRLVRRRQPGSRRGVMVGGRGVVLSEESGVLDGDLFLAVELSVSAPGEHADLLVRRAVSVDQTWLPSEELESRLVVEFNSQRERVEGWFETRFRDLAIERKEAAVPNEAAATALGLAAEADLEKALALDRPEVTRFLERVSFLRESMPELSLPAFDSDQLKPLLSHLAAGKRSFEELRRAPLLEILRSQLTHRQREALESEAPDRLEVPSGSKIQVLYQSGNPPVLPVRIQELFGCRETPRLAGGRVTVLLHLLAPNNRPQQVTQDLAGFWANTYPQVRRELRGRYPKHAWPEDPLTAQPERRPRRRK